MSNPFITKPKPKQDGTFWPCRKCGKVPKDSEVNIYMENLGTKESPRWISCEDLDCFISQGGTKPDPKATSSGRKSMTPQQLYEYRRTFSEECWKYAEQKAELVTKDLPRIEQFKAQLEIYKAMMK